MKTGRLAQLDRVLVSGTRGRAFESRIARHNEIKGLRRIRSPFFIDQKIVFQPYFQPKQAI